MNQYKWLQDFWMMIDKYRMMIAELIKKWRYGTVKAPFFLAAVFCGCAASFTVGRYASASSGQAADGPVRVSSPSEAVRSGGLTGTPSFLFPSTASYSCVTPDNVELMEPELLILSYLYEEGEDASQPSDSMAGKLYKMLAVKDAQWTAGIFDLYNYTPDKLAPLLGLPVDAVSTPSGVIGEFENIQVHFYNGDGKEIIGSSNARSIVSMANALYYSGALTTMEELEAYASRLWEESHSYDVYLGDVYDCDGACLLEQEDGGEDGAEGATASEAGSSDGTGPAAGESAGPGTGGSGADQAENGSSADSAGSGGRALADGSGGADQAGDSDSGGMTDSSVGTDAAAGSGDTGSGAGSGGADSAESVGGALADGSGGAGSAGDGGGADSAGSGGRALADGSGGADSAESVGGALADGSGGAGQTGDSDSEGLAVSSVGTDAAVGSGDTGSGAGGGGSAESGALAVVSGGAGPAGDGGGNAQQTSGGIGPGQVSDKGAFAEDAEMEAGRCPGHVDFSIHITVRDVEENAGLFQTDTAGFLYPRGNWSGWNETAKGWVDTLNSQDWYRLYGLNTTDLLMQNPLTSAEIDRYMGMLPDNASQTRREFVRYALTSVGKIPYYWGGKPSAPGYTGNEFGSVVSKDVDGRFLRGLDCSGWVNWVYWSVTGRGLGAESSGTMVGSGRAISKSDLLPGDICIRTGTMGHVVIFLSWTEDGRMLCIQETSGNTNNVEVAVVDPDWQSYRRIID